MLARGWKAECPCGSSCGPDSFVDEFRDRAHDTLLLIEGELAVDRNRQALGGGAFGVREVAATMAEVRETGLQVKRHGIVDLIADAALVKVSLQRVAFGCTDDELVEDVMTIGRLDRQRDEAIKTGSTEQRAVARGIRAAAIG